jgi:hypothetical protein
MILESRTYIARHKIITMGLQPEGAVLVFFTLFFAAVLWALCKRDTKDNPTHHAVPRKLIGYIDNIRNYFTKELKEKNFISVQTLQGVLHRDQVRQLLESTPHDGCDVVSEHISSHSLKFLALLILEGDHRRIHTYLNDPFGGSDAYFGCAEGYNGHFYQWKEPNESLDGFTLHEGHWKIPPVLDPEVIVKYPTGFIMPFYNAIQLTEASSSGMLYKAQVGEGHLENCDTVIVRD